MSKYSRTRKAICRVSKLKEWLVTRSEFKKRPIKTWKQTYKIYRRDYNSLFKGIEPKLPRYQDAKKLFPIWSLPGINLVD